MTYPILIETELECDEMLIESDLFSSSMDLCSSLDVNSINTDHNLLSHRNAADSHPIDAITDLNELLLDRPSEAISRSEILEL